MNARQVIALTLDRLSDRRRAVWTWGLPLGLMSGFIVAIYPSVREALEDAVRGYPTGLKEAFGIGEISNVGQYLHAEMLSLIVPLALGYLAVRAVASGLSGASETGSLDVWLSAQVSRRVVVAAAFAAAAVELMEVLVLTWLLTAIAGAVSGAGLEFGPTIAAFANVWPLALVFAGLGVVVTGLTLRTAVVTGSVAGVLVAMYVLDLVGRLDPDLSGIRYVSVFKYYGNAGEAGLNPLAFSGLVLAAFLLAALGSLLFNRRDLSA